jgi:hypothetical protein
MKKCLDAPEVQKTLSANVFAGHDCVVGFAESETDFSACRRTGNSHVSFGRDRRHSLRLPNVDMVAAGLRLVFAVHLRIVAGIVAQHALFYEQAVVHASHHPGHKSL